MHPLLSIDIWSSFKNEKQQLPTVQHQPLSTRGGKLVRRVTGPLFGRRTSRAGAIPPPSRMTGPVGCFVSESVAVVSSGRKGG